MTESYSRPPLNTAEEKALLEKVFPQYAPSDSYVRGAVAVHGNEPYLIVASAWTASNRYLESRGLKGTVLLLPKIYPQMNRILLEEFPDQGDNIFLSDELGRIQKETEFTRAGYQAHINNVASNQPRVQEEYSNSISRPIDATSLSGEVRTFNPQNERLEINAGSNVSGERSHFIFPITLSRLIQSILDDPQALKHYDPKKLEIVQRYAEELEKKYRSVIIPQPGTRDLKEPEIPTLPFKRKQTPPNIGVKPEKGIYVMGSGSGIGQEFVLYQAEQLEKIGFDVFRPPWLTGFGKEALPNILFHPNIVAVLARAGMGIVWLSLVAGKPVIAIPPNWDDCPEINMNIHRLEKEKLGVELRVSDDVVERAQEFASNIPVYLNKVRKENGIPDYEDGPSHAARRILESEIQKYKQ